MKKAMLRLLDRIIGVPVARALQRRLDDQQRDLGTLRMLVGQLHGDRVRTLPAGTPLQQTEFRAFSQWGEDGIIEHLLTHVPVEHDVFVEFGVEDYTESNTRFLLQRRNWSGLVIDGDPANIAAIRRDPLSWRHDLRAIQAFVTAENINSLLDEAGVRGDIGLLSVDIDGMDYWVWKAIDTISPRVVVCEYNSLFGAERAVTVPYSSGFERRQAHFSNLYFGASLPALCELAREKGYAFVGCTSGGNDAFFVRDDVLGGLRPLEPEEGYVAAKARQSRDESGALTHLGDADALALIADCEVEDVRTGERLTVRELGG